MNTKIVSEEFGFTEVATGGANNRGKVKRLEDVNPHGADHYTSLYGHAEDFADYVDDPTTGKGKGSCRGYVGAVKPFFVPADIDRGNLDDSLTDTRNLMRRLHEDYGVPKDVLRAAASLIDPQASSSNHTRSCSGFGHVW